MESSPIFCLLSFVAFHGALACNNQGQNHHHGHYVNYGRHHYPSWGGYHEGYSDGYWDSYSDGRFYTPYHSVYYAARPVGKPPSALAHALLKTAFHPRSWTDANCTYEIRWAPSTWEAAREDCDKSGARLAVLPSATASKHVGAMIEGAGGDGGAFWIGASDTDAEEKWVWVDEKFVGFADWRSGEPDGDHRQNCAAFNAAAAASDDVKIDGGWSDDDCEEAKPFVCQKC